MKKFNFTLTELLTVIAIIAILAGLLLPAINTARQKARITSVQADIQAIKTAIISMKTTYGKMANEKSFGGQDTPTKNNSPHIWRYCGGAAGATNRYSNYMRELMGIGKASDDSPDQGKTFLNTKKVQFLPIPPNFDDTKEGDKKLKVDPWGNTYYIAIYAYDKVTDSKAKKFPKITMPFFDGKKDVSKEFYGDLFILSKGPDKEMVEPTSTANTQKNKDNIISWKE